jgi:hypothetical protein
MIDTISLFARPKNFTVQPKAELTVAQNSYDSKLQSERRAVNPAAVPLAMSNKLFSQGGQPISGRKAFANVDGIRYDIMWHGLYVAFEVPKLLHQTAITPLDYDDLKKVPELLYNKMDAFGVDADPDKMEIVRLHFARNGVMNRSVPAYFPVISQSRGRRLNDKKQYGGTYIAIGNKSREVVAYNKFTWALENRGPDIQHPTGCPCEFCAVRPDTLRIETRFLKGASVKTHAADFKAFPDLVDKYDDMQIVYKQQLRDLVFGSELLDLDHVDEYTANQRMFIDKGFDTWLSASGVEKKVAALGGWDKLIKFVKMNSTNRSASDRGLKQLRELSELDRCNNNQAGTWADLSEELQQKFLDE